MDVRLQLIPLAIALSVAACDAPETLCEDDDQVESLDLAADCGFSRRYRAVSGSLDDGDIMLTDLFQVEDDPNRWRMVGSVEGVHFGLDIQPQGCSGQFKGLWWGDGLLLAVDFEGTIEADRVEFSTFDIRPANSYHYEGIMTLAPYPYDGVE